MSEPERPPQPRGEQRVQRLAPAQLSAALARFQTSQRTDVDPVSVVGTGQLNPRPDDGGRKDGGRKDGLPVVPSVDVSIPIKLAAAATFNPLTNVIDWTPEVMQPGHPDYFALPADPDSFTVTGLTRVDDDPIPQVTGTIAIPLTDDGQRFSISVPVVVFLDGQICLDPRVIPRVSERDRENSGRDFGDIEIWREEGTQPFLDALLRIARQQARTEGKI